jgi:Tfp pilus assembly protein PilO
LISKLEQTKNLASENEKLKSELTRKEKQMIVLNKKADELKEFQKTYEESASVVENLKQ